jgi:hypothetical protein
MVRNTQILAAANTGELRVKDPERFTAKAGTLTPGQSAA